MRKKEHIYEEYLVASAKLGDAHAMRRLVEFRGPKLMAHATRLLGDREQAKDATQDAWADILKGLVRLQDNRAFAAWAYRITTRRCGKLIRGLQASRKLAQDLPHETEWVTKDQGEDAADACTVRAALLQLPPDQRATMALFYLEDMSVADVAQALDIPAGTVKTRLMHARAKLKDILKGKLDE